MVDPLTPAEKMALKWIGLSEKMDQIHEWLSEGKIDKAAAWDRVNERWRLLKNIDQP